MHWQALMIAILLAGCTNVDNKSGDDADGLTPAANFDETASGVARDFIGMESVIEFTGCQEVMIGRFVAMEAARELLPDGMQPVSAEHSFMAALFWQQWPSHREHRGEPMAAMFGASLHCDGPLGKEPFFHGIVIPIHPVGHPEVDDSGYGQVFYGLPDTHLGGLLLDSHRSVGGNLPEFSFEGLNVGLNGLQTTGHMRAVGEGLLASHGVEAGQPSQAEVEIFFWIPEGNSWITWDYSRGVIDVATGLVTECEIDGGSYATALGDCEPTDWGMLFPSFGSHTAMKMKNHGPISLTDL